jgi:hypothetical protein
LPENLSRGLTPAKIYELLAGDYFFQKNSKKMVVDMASAR